MIVLDSIEKIEQKNNEILTQLESYAKHQDLVLKKILHVDEHIEALTKKIKSTAQEDPHF